jgi:hypothetical protein
MANFVVINNSLYAINDINVIYVDEQSMNNQEATADGVTVLSDSSIPTGTAVQEVNVAGTVITEEPVTIPVGHGRTLIATLVYFTNPKSGQQDVVGMEASQEEES